MALSLEVSKVPLGLFVDGAESLVLTLLWEGGLWLGLLPFPSGRVIDCASGHILDLDVFLSPREDNPHLGDFVLHQMLVEGVSNL